MEDRMTSIARTRSAQSFARSTNKLVVFNALSGVDKKSADQLTPREDQLTHDWFTAYIDCIKDDIRAVDDALPSAAAGDQEGLINLKTDLDAKRTDAEQEQNVCPTRSPAGLPTRRELRRF
jgi:hypothetical protein